jgi:hypothetical protein
MATVDAKAFQNRWVVGPLMMVLVPAVSDGDGDSDDDDKSWNHGVKITRSEFVNSESRRRKRERW